MAEEITKPGVATQAQRDAVDADNAVTVGSITITPGGGGWYTLKGGLLVDEERVQGKGAMETRVNELNEAANQAAGISPNFPEQTQAPHAAAAALDEKQDEKAPAIKAPMPNSFDRVLTAKEKAAVGVKFVDIILEENEDIPPTGLFLSHNHRGYMIVPGEKVSVPDFLIGILDDAVTSAPVVNPNTKQVVGYRDRRRFPYQRA